MLRLLSWPVLCAVTVLLTSCSDLDKQFAVEFAVQSARSAVEVSLDGTAVVSESFDISVKRAENYGGVYVDIPQRFKDASGGVHWRDFDLIAARRDGRDEYYSIENNLPGHSIYIGEAHCKNCYPNLPLGTSNIEIVYRLDRMVRQEGDRQVLFLPAYLGHIQGRGAEKTIILVIPPGGVPRLSHIDPAAYAITQNAPNQFVVSIGAGNRDRVLPDIEIEYPGGTFQEATSGELMRRWLSDHFLTFASILGPLIVCLFVAVRVRASRRLLTPVINIDGEITESISPALAAYLFRNWSADSVKAAYLASALHHFVKGKREAKGARPQSLPVATRLVVERNREEWTVEEMEGKFYDAVVEEYRQARGADRWSSATVVSAAVLYFTVAYFSGLLGLSLGICGILITFLFAVLAFWETKWFAEPIITSEKFKQAVVIFLGYPMMMIFFIFLVVESELISDQLPYLVAISLDIIGIIVVISMRFMPTPKERQIRNNLMALNRYLLGEINGPKMSIECYEYYVPFAIALGVEKRWAERFDLWQENEKMGAHSPDGPISSWSEQYS